MNTKELLIEHFKSQPKGTILSHQQAQAVFGVSEKTVDRIMAKSRELQEAGIEVTRQVSFVKVGGDVPAKDTIVDPNKDTVPVRDNGLTINIPEDLLQRAIAYRKRAFEEAEINPVDFENALKAGVTTNTKGRLLLFLIDRYMAFREGQADNAE